MNTFLEMERDGVHVRVCIYIYTYIYIYIHIYTYIYTHILYISEYVLGDPQRILHMTLENPSFIGKITS